MSCKWLWIDCGSALCDCASPKAGGQINDHGICNPEICKIPMEDRE